MGPRPPRSRPPALTGPRVAVARQPGAAPSSVAPVGAPSPRRTPTFETVPLPADTRRTLSGIVKQLRDVPRAIIGDPAEVVHFLGRTARALERLRDEPVLVEAPAAQAKPSAILSGASGGRSSAPPVSPRDHGEAVFSSAGAASTPLMINDPGTSARTVATRKGRQVRVEVRRARAAGQLEMPV